MALLIAVTRMFRARNYTTLGDTTQARLQLTATELARRMTVKGGGADAVDIGCAWTNRQMAVVAR